MNKASINLFSLTILIACLWPRAIHAQSSNALVSAPAPSGVPPFDPVAYDKMRVKGAHEMVLAQEKLSPVWYTTAGKILTRQAISRLMIRPPGIDDEGWERYQLMLELIFQGNQPIEFYARVVDQNGEPVVGARLELRLSGVDTDKVLAKFPHMNMGEEQTSWTNMAYSDADGWVRLKGIAGHYLNVWSISKEGYLSKYQDNIAGGVIYETNSVVQTGHVKTTGELTMDALNPKKGYTFRLSKIK